MTEDLLPRQRVEGREFELPDGRKVFVGHRLGCDSTHLRLQNGDRVTCLRLTPEAAVALHILLGDGDRGLPATYPIAEPVMRWQEVASEAAMAS